jgi:endonuclease YncB( thermonuclease family)
MTRWLFLLLALSWPAEAAQKNNSIAGVPTVTDGDTLRIGDTRIRLFGIDAPEGKQTCERDGMPWLCGQEAGKALRELVAGVTVSCAEHDRDRYKRSVSVCTLADGTDLGGFMVSNGYAVAYRQYSTRYVEAENHAREAKRGLWSGTFQRPWEWRRAQRGVPKRTEQGTP